MSADLQSDNLLLYRDMFNLMCGAKLGQGSARTVYVFAMNAKQVIKVEPAGSNQNVMEWQAWRVAEGTKYEKWFAPCRELSNDGRVLVMDRTQPMDPDRAPVRMPAFLCDFKFTNYGMLNGRVVCHDYGVSMLMEKGLTSRMCKADWWRSEPRNYQ